jgi:tetratricopeptide (TPR) repeat protein
MFYLPYNLAAAKEKPVIEIVHDPFTMFYPHLGNSICRKKAFEIAWDKTIARDKKTELWKNYEAVCSVDGSYQLILADFYISLGRHYEEAKQTLEQAINSANYDTRYHKSLLHAAYLGLNEKSKAIALAKKMINDYPDWYRGYQDLGADFLNVKDWNNSKKYLEKALKMHVQDPVTYLLLVVVSYELKEDEKVIEYYHKAFLLDPYRPYLDRRSSAAAVVVYVNKGKFDVAKDILDHQQKFIPDIYKERMFIEVKQYYENALKKANKSDK